MLAPGKIWFRYYMTRDGVQDYQNQARSCPVDMAKTYGCTVYQGYAWGQRDEAVSEFTTPDSMTMEPTLTAHFVPQDATPIVPTLNRDQCRQLRDAWLKQHPAMAKCLTHKDRQKLTEICLKVWNTHELTEEEGQAKIARVFQKACAARAAEEPKPAVSEPDEPEDEVTRCRRDVERRVSTLPQEIRDCIEEHPTALERLKQICVRQLLGEITDADAADEADRVIDEACNGAGRPVPPSPTSPGGETGAPEMPPAEEEALDEIEGTDGSSTPLFDGGASTPTTRDTEKASAFRRWGPVVGVMVVVAGAAYALRPRKRKPGGKAARKGTKKR